MLNEAKKETFILQKKLFEANKSQLQIYQDLIIGQRGLVNLIKYELIVSLSSWVPGALGLFLRSKLYPLLLGKVGKGVIFGTNVVLRHPYKIYLGDRVVIDDNCVLDAKGTNNKGIFLGNDVFVGRNTIIYCKDGDIFIGDNSTISFNCDIFSANLVKLGENVQIAAYTFLNGGTHSFDRTDIPVINQERSGKQIIVADNVWLGANVKILDGVTIGKDAIVGAGAVVINDLPPFCIAGGLPARVIRMRDESRPGEEEYG
jgi:acetyltransferase-like isoleucine patch superfamily enzyme